MNLDTANAKNKIEYIDIYRNRSINELMSIHPKWACGKNISKLFDFSLHPQNNEYSIFFVDTFELIRHSEFYEVNPEILFTGERLNDRRVTGVLFQWENKKYIDPPTIYTSLKAKDKILYSDGRHRTKVAYHLDQKIIPIAIHNSQKVEISRIVKFLSNVIDCPT